MLEGYAPSTPLLKKALELYCRDSVESERDTVAARIAGRVASGQFDGDTWDVLATRQVHVARDTGRLSALPVNLGYLASLRIHEGRLDEAARLLQEAEAIGAATGNPPGAPSVLLAACRGDELTATRLLAVVEADATARADGVATSACEHARAVLHNGLGNYTTALAAAEQALGADTNSSAWWVLAELIEAAARAGAPQTATEALSDLAQRSAAADTDLAHGIERRSHALLAPDAEADAAHREALEALDRTRMRMWLARTHLVYGEWLRRTRRRVDARDQLRAAHAMFTEFGAAAFAERTRSELLATGERMRKRRGQPDIQLTAQEEQIAALARDGFSNPEIGVRLYISPRTVEWHLRRVYTKLGINSRRGLRLALATSPRELSPP